jgi:hypothetical protein
MVVTPEPTSAPASPERTLLALADNAQLAQVKRPVVSTWRRRHPDFPAAVTESSGSPLFDGDEVAEWLLTTGLGNADPKHLRAEMCLYGNHVAATAHEPWRMLEVVGALLCLRLLDERPLLDLTTAPPADADLWSALLHRAERMDPDDEFLLRELRSADADAAPLARLAEDLVEAAFSEHAAHEWLLAARSRLGLHTLAADAVAPGVLDLLAELTDLPARLAEGGNVTLADPAAGAGDLLAGVLRQVDERDDLTVLAADPDARRARITRRRLLLAGVHELNLDVRVGDELEERLADPDLIVTQLPYRPGEERSLLAALEGVERVADLLGPGSTALVLGPADALVDALPGTEESQFRSALLRRTIVESVVSLPGGALPYRPGYRPALWTLTRNPVPATEGKVLLADISTEALVPATAARLAEDVLLWRAEGFRPDGHDPRFGRVVTVADLDRAFGGPLTPPAAPAMQYHSRTVTERPALIAEAESRLERAAEEARAYGAEHGPYRGGVQRRVGRLPRRTTLGTLVRQGRVRKRPGYRVDEADVTASGHHPVIGAEELTGHRPVGARRMDRMVLAAKYDRVSLTEPGDVVYTLSPQLGLYVDHDGFSVVAYPARVLRVRADARRPLRPRVLAALLGAARGTGRSPSAVRAARRIDDYQLPDLEPDEVERFDALLAEVERREQQLRAQADALDEARRLSVAGLADGTLTTPAHGPPGPPLP